MKIQIRQSVFETNSSSVHSFSFVEKPKFLNWKLEDYSGRTLVYKNDEIFDPAKQYGRYIASSGEKLTLFISLLGNYFECSADLDPNFKKTKEDFFKQPVFKWISEAVFSLYNVNLVWEGTKNYPFIETTWSEDTEQDIFNQLLKMMKIESFPFEDFITKEKERFMMIFESYLFRKDIVIKDDYQEW